MSDKHGKKHGRGQAPEGKAAPQTDEIRRVEITNEDAKGAEQPQAPDAGQTVAKHEEPAVPQEKAPQEQLAELEAKFAELNDQYLRKAADFDNFRKRMQREKQEAIDYANQSLLLDIIPIMDDFERALKSAEGSAKTEADFDSFLTGVSMIEKRLAGQLEAKWGLKRFDSAGAVFNPERHEALMSESSPDVEEPMVSEDLMKGYTLKDRVIRTAKVKVKMPG
jgi:molecular chaperone GrpE